MKKILNITLFIDFLISFGFGLVSWLSPKGTFGTLISGEEMNKSLITSLLSSLSIFYILIGLACLSGFKANQPFKNWVASIMIIRHAWIGISSILALSVANNWQIGSSSPDIIIHTLFVIFYLIGIYFYRKKKITNDSFAHD